MTEVTTVERVTSYIERKVQGVTQGSAVQYVLHVCTYVRTLDTKYTHLRKYMTERCYANTENFICTNVKEYCARMQAVHRTLFCVLNC